MAGLKSSKEGIWRLPVDADLPVSDAPAVIKMDEPVSIDADMIEASIRTDLKIGPAGRFACCLELDQGRSQMMTNKRERRVAWAISQRADNFGRAFRACAWKFKDAVRRETRGKSGELAAISVDRVACHEIGNGHAFGNAGVSHAVRLGEILMPEGWHAARCRHKGHPARGDSQ